MYFLILPFRLTTNSKEPKMSKWMKGIISKGLTEIQKFTPHKEWFISFWLFFHLPLFIDSFYIIIVKKQCDITSSQKWGTILENKVPLQQVQTVLNYFNVGDKIKLYFALLS